ncbi:hypothetical protein Q8W71_32565 [Methylobacterium sp. NEAU 140]|uniref:hypothetical protein n=1 Tax=Methylobacterium sp. NEAU 140 TaxID=3064945 RepID=UPI0027354E8C|nr:hypothetical protein [Methylobacterium sp. NEAU 140]MDP4027297.1 hypothetical protein [Methylobacterium sp. NEAU 140]
MHDDPVSPLQPPTVMARLIDLLGEMPVGPDRHRAEAVAERLDLLEYEARWHGAPEGTLAAIRGARVLLGLTDLPPMPPIASHPGSRR